MSIHPSIPLNCLSSLYSIAFNTHVGKAAVNALMREAYTKTTGKPAFSDPAAAEKALQDMLVQGSLFAAVDRTTNPKHVLLAKNQSVFSSDTYYVWVYEGAQWKGMLMVKTIIQSKVRLILCESISHILFSIHPGYRRSPHHPRRRHVPTLACKYADRCLLPFTRYVGSHGRIFRIGYCSSYCLGLDARLAGSWWLALP